MTDEKDRFGDTMRLVERAREDIYFADRDQELLVKLREKVTGLKRRATTCAVPNAPDSWVPTHCTDSFSIVAPVAAESGWT
jgi:hypothetical protein